MNEKLVELALQNLPGIISGLKGLFTTEHPGEPTPTNEEVMAAYHTAITSSLGVDSDWLKTHPPTSGEGATRTP